ncbi:sulfotransferase family 2 domain-containing protein [Faunimonas sp. B44]|uniref:sulfotransferase family 2 domain-containing protein n=1 Tax=Faunimonas sp. B44 TaxID=3461493 RepID=UPI004043C795
MYVSIHIPKTAGTSLGNIFDYCSGRRVFWDYSPSYDNALVISPLIASGLPFICEYFKFIHGHFYYRKYADTISSAKFISCVRHPVKRIVSQYYHVGLEKANGDWRTPLIASGKMDAVEFASADPNTLNAMSVHLAGREIEEYDFIFVTEKLHHSVEAFSTMFNYRLAMRVPTVNTTEGRRVVRDDVNIVPVTAEHERKLFSLSVQDVDVYQRAVATFLKQ